jgi:hypothetical protein
MQLTPLELETAAQVLAKSTVGKAWDKVDDEEKKLFRQTATQMASHFSVKSKENMTAFMNWISHNANKNKTQRNGKERT